MITFIVKTQKVDKVSPFLFEFFVCKNNLMNLIN